jgi:ankyrin repeat protein
MHVFREVLEVLIKAGADVNATVTSGYYKGWTALHFASKTGFTYVLLCVVACAHVWCQGMPPTSSDLDL